MATRAEKSPDLREANTRCPASVAIAAGQPGAILDMTSARRPFTLGMMGGGAPAVPLRSWGRRGHQ